MKEDKKIVLPIPENLRRLYDTEEKIRNESILYIAGNPDCAFQLEIMQTALNMIHDISIENKSEDIDENTIRNIGCRLYNTTSVSYKLILAGYYQSALALMRDLLEVSFLLAWFKNDKSKIAQWRTMSRKDRRKNIDPIIYNDLDKNDGATERKRAKYHWLFCEYATHITPKFPKLLMLHEKIMIGPFFYDAHLKNCLIELAKLLILCTLPFISLFITLPQDFIKPRMEFLSKIEKWSTEFLRPFNVEDLERWLE